MESKTSFKTGVGGNEKHSAAEVYVPPTNCGEIPKFGPSTRLRPVWTFYHANRTACRANGEKNGEMSKARISGFLICRNKSRIRRLPRRNLPICTQFAAKFPAPGRQLGAQIFGSR